MAPSVFSSTSAVEKPNVVTGFSTEDDLDKVWMEIIVRCNKITKWDLNEKKTVTVDQVLAKINPPKEKDDKAELKSNAKKVFKNALICVQRFGSFAANTASMVFGPSQQCFNAISFVITAVQDYDAVFGNITTLMERVSVFMEKLRIYLDDNNADVKLDKRLRLTVYKVLEHFLMILGLTHKLTKGWKGKLKLAVEVGAFGKDEGIKDSMAKLETLIADVTSSEISVIVKELSEAARNIRGVDRKLDQIAEASEKTLSTLGHLETGQEKAGASLGRLEAGQERANATLGHLETGQDKANTSLGHLETAEQRRGADEEERKRIKEIAEGLSIDVNKRYWKDRQDELWTKSIENTGAWLLTYHTFERWADVNETNEDTDEMPTMKPLVNVLGLKADEGYGKSYLCSIVIEHLLQKHHEDPRIAVAYYYFQRERDVQDKRRMTELVGTSGDLDPNPTDSTQANVSNTSNAINKALKAIIFQLATSKTSLGRDYSKLIQKACSSKTNFGKSAELWKTLITDISKGLEGTFYIVLDGIDETDGEPGRPLAKIIQNIMYPSVNAQLKIRLFFSGRPMGVQSLSGDDQDGIPEIRIAPEGEPSLNEEDIMLYAQERLDKMKIFQDESFAEWKDKTKTVLGQAVRGDYSSLSLKLSKVDQCRTVRELEKELGFANENRMQGVAREMEALNLTLKEDEIQELNQLLVFEAVCFGDNSVKVYEQYLALHAETQSLVSLKEQFKERYSTVFDVEDDPDDENSGTVTLRTDDLREYLRDEDEDAKKKANEPGLQEGEITLVRRIIKTHFNNIFGSEETYGKFAFDTFFEEKLKGQPVKIHIGSLTECHIRVAQACLTAICDHFDEEEDYSDFDAYAWEWFSDHLVRVPIEEIEAATLQDIGRRLVRILWETPFIDRWWTYQRMSSLRQYWVYQKFSTDIVFKILGNPVVHKGLIDLHSERQWVMSTTAEEGTGVRIFTHVAKRMAERWFEHFDDTWYLSMDFLHGYLSHLRGEEPDFTKDVTLEQLALVEEWSKDILGNGDQEGRWHARLGETLMILEYWPDAAARYRLAVELLPEEWKLKLSLATALGNNKEWKEAVETLENLIATTQEQITTDEELKITYWETMLHLIGDYSIRLENFEQAETTYRTVLEEGKKKDTFEEFAKKAVYFMTLALNKQGKHKEAIETFQELEQRTDEESGNWLNILFHYYAADDEFHDRVALATLRSDSVSIMVEKYKSAIELAQKDDSGIGTVLQLEYFHAALLSFHNTAEERETAFGMWENIMYRELPDGAEESGWVRWAQIYAARKLGVRLLDSAKEAGLSTPMNSEAEGFATRLKKLTEGDPAIVSEGYKNTKVSLARLYHLAGDDEKARDVLRDHVKSSFEKIETPEQVKDGWYQLANSFQALDDDENALAAWGVFMPTKPSAEDEDEDNEEDADEDADENANEDADGNANEEANEDGEEGEWQGFEDESNDVNEDGAEATNGVEEADETEDAHEEPQAVAGAEDVPENEAVNGEENLTNGVHPTNGEEEEEGGTTNGEENPGADGNTDETPQAPAEEDEEAEEEEELTGMLTQSCDGHCEKTWSYLGEVEGIMACKDCLDVQLEPDCYAKLRAGTLDVQICSPNHTHFRLPSFDREKWEQTGPEQMWVGGALVSRAEWIEKVKKEWKIDEATLKAQERFLWSVRRIQRAWRLSRWIKKGKSIGDSDLLLRCLI